MDEGVALVRERLARARNVMVITGAGVSAESGIPTFRDEKGLWKEFNPLDYATREAFKRDPAKVWKWYDERRVKAAQARPNPAHRALAEMVRPGPAGVHRDPECRRPAREGRLEGNRTHPRLALAHPLRARGHRAREPRDAAVREPADLHVRRNHAARRGLVRRGAAVAAGRTNPPLSVDGGIDLCFVVGTEATFGYIVQWALQAREAGAMVVDINPLDTGLGSLVDVHLQGKAGEVLPRLV
jgi:NAD-dependent deacetylase